MVVAGELDLATAAELRAAVLRESDGGARSIAIDLNAVPFVDSSGLGTIVACLKHLRELGGELVLVSLEGSAIRKLLGLTGLDGAVRQVATAAELPASA